MVERPIYWNNRGVGTDTVGGVGIRGGRDRNHKAQS
jgi:hypothetical protein